MARAKVAPEPDDGDEAPVGSSRSGWCSSGQCLPSPYTNGCRGTFGSYRCACPCHDGEVPPRALRVQQTARERFEKAQAESPSED